MSIFEDRESNVRSYCRVYPTVFASASNARQTDEAGKSYIDFFAGAGVLNYGHNNEGMKKALVQFIEADGVAHSLDTYTTAKREFLEKFVSVVLEPRNMPHKIAFTGPTGTNAVEIALKLARRVTGRTAVAAFSHGFHGMTLGSLACTANSYFRNASGVPLDHVVHHPFDGMNQTGAQAVQELRDIYEDSSSGLEPPAAFLVEPIQAEGGVNVATQEWLLALQQLAKDLGALLVVDDIQAGCGRTGSFFSFDGMGLEPDIVILAKGIGGFGTPLAMNLIKPEHDEHWSPGEHTGTFRGQGFSFVAGREALTYFEDDALMNDVKRKGAVMEQKLRDLVEKNPARGMTVRGKGMLLGLDVGDGALAKKMVAKCFEKGLLLGACGTGGRVLKLIPPLTIPDEDLMEGLSLFTMAVEEGLGES